MGDRPRRECHKRWSRFFAPMMTEVTTGFAKSHVSERRAGLHSFGFAIWPVQPFKRRGITTRMPTDGGGQERTKPPSIGATPRRARCCGRGRSRCWGGPPLGTKRTQSARIKAPSKGIGGRSGNASPGLSLAFVHEDLPGRALASSAVVTTTACFAMTMSSSIVCTSASGSAQQSRTTTNP